jgi:hypothetical protein
MSDGAISMQEQTIQIDVLGHVSDNQQIACHLPIE